MTRYFKITYWPGSANCFLPGKHETCAHIEKSITVEARDRKDAVNQSFQFINISDGTLVEEIVE